MKSGIKLKGLAGRLRRCIRGGVALPFSLAMMPISFMVLSAWDYHSASEARASLQDALDSAALAVGRSKATTDDEAQVVGENVLEANLVNTTVDLNASDFDIHNGVVTATASAEIPTVAAGLLMRESIDVRVSTEVTRSKNIEVSLVLDTTGSMAGQKIVDLRTAANDLVDIVVKDEQSPFYTKVAIAPYSMGVNAGSYAAQVRGTYFSGTSTTPGSRYYKFRNEYNDERTFEISTCVTERTGVNAYTDAAPSTAFVGRNYPSANNPCPASNVIVPLSSNRTTLKTKINSLQASGSTAGHVGVAWGWYLLSPNFSYLWASASQPGAYDDSDLIKVVVLMTDGEYNSSYCNGVISKDSTTGSGSAEDHINCNATNGHAFTQAQALCTAIKAKKVIVYTVGFNVVNDQRAKDLVNRCATDANRVYLPTTGTDLKAAFRAIGQDISALRISK
jgi:Flp pilus assembly protein TadG